MGEIKVYKDLIEALDDIKWDGLGKRDRFIVKHHGRLRDIREEELKIFFKDFEEWIMKDSRIAYKKGEKYATITKNILWELVKNAEHPCRIGQGFEAEIYFGKEGTLMGTRQDARFLSQEEIEMLEVWKEAVYSTKYGLKNPPLGKGTQMFIERGDGLVILPKQKAIYVSKHA